MIEEGKEDNTGKQSAYTTLQSKCRVKGALLKGGINLEVHLLIA